MTLKFDIEERKNGVYQVEITTPEMQATVEATTPELRRLGIDIAHHVGVDDDE
jgi:hypothetical protein